MYGLRAVFFRGWLVAVTGGIDADLDSRNAADWLLCRAGAGLCALPLGHVLEIMRPLPIEPVAAPPPGLSGLSLIRGTPVPVLDLAVLLGESAGPIGRFITATVEGRRVALAVESVLGVRRIDPALMDELPPLLRDSAGEAVAAIGTLDAELLRVLQTGRLVPEDLFDRPSGEASS
jgi:purine-binding chemotaxis protein CheW